MDHPLRACPRSQVIYDRQTVRMMSVFAYSLFTLDSCPCSRWNYRSAQLVVARVDVFHVGLMYNTCSKGCFLLDLVILSEIQHDREIKV